MKANVRNGNSLPGHERQPSTARPTTPGSLTVYAVTTDEYGGTTRSSRRAPTPWRASDMSRLASLLPKVLVFARQPGDRLRGGQRGRGRAPGPVARLVGRCRAGVHARRRGHARRPGTRGRLRRAAERRSRSRSPHSSPRTSTPPRRPSSGRATPPVAPPQGQGSHGLPAGQPDHPVRRRPVPGLQLHAGVGCDARPPRVRHRDRRLRAPHPPGRPGRRARASTTSRRRCGAATASRRPPASCARRRSRTCWPRATAR